jgi:hypothetical protein
VCFQPTSGGPAGSGYLGQCYNAKSTDPANGDPVAVGAGQTVTGIDAHLQPGGAVTGRVTDESGAGVNANIEVFDGAGTLLPVTGSTDSDGNYTVMSIPPGTVRVCFRPNDVGVLGLQCYNGKPYDPAAADPIDLAAGAVVTGIDAHLSAPVAAQRQPARLR